ncbi:MAG TPA: hypothetical protein VL359_17560, partial [bacterium]|nr:hypothetical protein [bacterium]
MKITGLTAKVFGVLAVALLGSLIIAGTGIYVVKSDQKAIDEVGNGFAKRRFLARTMQLDVMTIRNIENTLILDQSAEGRQQQEALQDRVEKDLLAAMAEFKSVASGAALDDLLAMANFINEWRPYNR